MANIIWSFGIALQAQDQASKPINDVIISLNEMEKSLKRVNEAAMDHADILKGLTRDYEQFTDSLGSLGSIGDEAEEVGDKLSGSLDAFEGYITGGVSLVMKGISGVLGGLASGVVKTVTVAGSLAFSIIKKTVETTLSVATSLVAGTANAVKGALLSPLLIVETIINSGVLTKLYAGVENFLSLGNAFGPIDKQLRQVSAQMGMSSASATKLIDTVIDMSLQTGFAVKNMSDLAVALGRTGQNLSDIKPETTQVLGHLAETFGLGADETVRFSAAAQRVGVDVKQLAGEAVVFQEKFGIPGLMQMLPQVTNMAADAITRFSKSVVGNQRQLIETTLKTSAIYAKAFGKDIGEATHMAQATFEGFAGAAQNNADLMLGLADSVSPLSMALLQGGASWNEMNQVIAEGQNEPVVAAEHMRNLINSMAPGPAQERFKRLLQKELPEGMKQLVFDNNAFAKAQQQQAYASAIQSAAITEGTTKFDEMADSMRDNFDTLRDVMSNVKTAIKSLFGSLFTDTMKTSLKAAVGHLETFGKGIGNLVTEIKASPIFKSLQTTFQSIATVLVTAGEAAGVMAEGLLSVQGSSLSLSKFFLGISSGVGFFETIGKTMKEVSTIMNGSAKGFNKLGEIIEVVTGNALDYFDSFFFGLPTKIVKSFATGIDKEKATFRSSVMGLLDSAYDGIKNILKDWNKDIPPKLTEMWSNAGAAVGESLGSIAKTVTDFIGSLFNADDRSRVLQQFTDMFDASGGETDSIISSLTSIVGKGLDAVEGFIKSFADSFLLQYGTNSEIMLGKIKLGFENFSLGAGEALGTVKDAMLTMYEVGFPVFQALTTIAGYAIQGIAALGSGFVAVTSEATKAALYVRSLLPEALGGISKATYDASLKEATDMTEKIQAKIGGFSNTVSGIQEAINKANPIDVVAEREALEKKQNDRIKDRINMAKEELELRKKEAKFQTDLTAAAKKRQEEESALKNQIVASKKEKEKPHAPEAGKPAAPTPDQGDVKSNYEKVLNLKGPGFADVWLDSWKSDHFDPKAMPPIPEGAGGGGGGAAPGKPAAPSPTTIQPKMSGSAEPDSTTQIAETLKELVAQLAQQQKDPMKLEITVDSHGIISIVDKATGRAMNSAMAR